MTTRSPSRRRVATSCPADHQITSQDLAGDYPAIQYGPPGVDFTIDVVSRLGEAYTFDDLEVTAVDVAGQAVRVLDGYRSDGVAWPGLHGT